MSDRIKVDGIGGVFFRAKDPTGLARILADTGIEGLGTLGIFISALEEENLVNVLANTIYI